MTVFSGASFILHLLVAANLITNESVSELVALWMTTRIEWLLYRPCGTSPHDQGEENYYREFFSLVSILTVYLLTIKFQRCNRCLEGLRLLWERLAVSDLLWADLRRMQLTEEEMDKLSSKMK